MIARLFLTIAAAACCAAGAARADDAKVEHGFVTRTHKGTDGAEVKYVLFVPHGYKGDTPYPVILFLHGAGETKGGQKMPADVGIRPAIKKHEKSFPFITIIPQAQTRGWGASTDNGKMAMAVLDE